MTTKRTVITAIVVESMGHYIVRGIVEDFTIYKRLYDNHDLMLKELNKGWPSDKYQTILCYTNPPRKQLGA